MSQGIPNKKGSVGNGSTEPYLSVAQHSFLIYWVKGVDVEAASTITVRVEVAVLSVATDVSMTMLLTSFPLRKVLRPIF